MLGRGNFEPFLSFIHWGICTSKITKIHRPAASFWEKEATGNSLDLVPISPTTVATTGVNI